MNLLKCSADLFSPNFVLADEINRAPAKVQSALLEAMQNVRLLLVKETFMLPEPFLVLATQNPIEQEGTYPLPEAQVDRFMLKVVIDYPKLEEEKLIIRQNINGEKFNVKPILRRMKLLKHVRLFVKSIWMRKIERYIVDIVFATRFPEKYDLKELKDMIGFGGSPRCVYQSGFGCSYVCIHQTSRLRYSGRCTCCSMMFFVTVSD